MQNTCTVFLHVLTFPPPPLWQFLYLRSCLYTFVYLPLYAYACLCVTPTYHPLLCCVVLVELSSPSTCSFPCPLLPACAHDWCGFWDHCIPGFCLPRLYYTYRSYTFSYHRSCSLPTSIYLPLPFFFHPTCHHHPPPPLYFPGTSTYRSSSCYCYLCRAAISCVLPLPAFLPTPPLPTTIRYPHTHTPWRF